MGIGRYMDGWIHVEISGRTLRSGDIGAVILPRFPRPSSNGTNFGGEQTLQMYGNVQGFPYNSALFGLVICARV